MAPRLSAMLIGVKDEAEFCESRRLRPRDSVTGGQFLANDRRSEG